MRIRTALALLLAAATTATATAETLVVDNQVTLRETTIETPRRGTVMSAVEAKFGVPRTRHAAVGDPPITRWDYEGFSVYFEHQHVVHTVALAQ